MSRSHASKASTGWKVLSRQRGRLPRSRERLRGGAVAGEIRWYPRADDVTRSRACWRVALVGQVAPILQRYSRAAGGAHPCDPEEKIDDAETFASEGRDLVGFGAVEETESPTDV